MKIIISTVLLLVCFLGCRNNPLTSAFPSIGQMLIAPFRHSPDMAPKSYFYTGIPDPNWTPLAKKIWQRDGTNFLGVYLGMIAEWDGNTSVYKPSLDANGQPIFGGTGTMVSNSIPQGVMMFSDTTGECLKWISYKDFKDIFVLKNRPEYLPYE